MVLCPQMTWAMWGGRPFMMASVTKTRRKSWGENSSGSPSAVVRPVAASLIFNVTLGGVDPGRSRGQPLADHSSCLGKRSTNQGLSVISVHDPLVGKALGELRRFRQEFYTCLTARADAVFELTDAVLCADGPVRSLAELSLVGEHRRGHGSSYAAVADGRVDIE